MGEGAVCVEALTDTVMGKENTSRTELKRDHHLLVDDADPEPFPNKKQAKEAMNDDINSEVSNPVISPKDNAFNCQDATSQSAELATSNPVGLGELTSTYSGNSSAVETLSEEGEPSSQNSTPQSDTPQNVTDGSVSKSHVVLEIPKHASSSGVRRIIFKFSKRKEEYEARRIASTAEPVTDGIGQALSYDEEHGRNYSTEMAEGREEYFCAPTMDLEMSKKVVSNNYPTNVKKLLSTGILDGAHVKYISFSPKRELEGIVDGGGYLCGCSLCNFSKVLSAYEFEQHAGVKTRHPNNHIYLKNGKPIYSIIQELKTAPLSILDEVIRDVAGSSINEEFFRDWKASLKSGMVRADKHGPRKSSCLPHSLGSCPSEALETSSSFVCNNPVRQQTYMGTSEEQKCALKRPSSQICSSVVKQKKTVDGGTKRRDNDLHRLLFMPNGLPDGAELAYYVKGQKMLGGYKQGNGIVCSCCDREISPSQFEAHAGMAARRQPYRHIYTSNGLTLHDIAISLANGQSLTTGVSDDMCAKCGDGGDLIFCESCPRAFHPGCLELQHAPDGVFKCPSCKKFGHGENSARTIIIRLTRVVKTPEYQGGGCVICRSHDFSGKAFNDRTVILCDQCEKEFHVGCLRKRGQCDLKEIPKDSWFCCDDCKTIHVALQDSVSRGVQIIPASLLNVINRKHAEKRLLVDGVTDDFQWQILMGKSREKEHLLLLSGAAAIFRECFDPIVAKTGRDLIPVMVYGRNISGQEFSGMYCVLLTVKSVVVSAGLLRIFGREVAELPLVATSREHQGKGYFQALFSCIERLLCSLSVETLVLPAAEEAESIWTKKFGFRKMSEGQLSKYTRELQLTIFRGTSMLEKSVPRIFE